MVLSVSAIDSCKKETKVGPRGRKKTPPTKHSDRWVFDLSTAHWVSRPSSVRLMRKNGHSGRMFSPRVQPSTLSFAFRRLPSKPPADLQKSIKKRPFVTLAWMNSRSGKPKGRGAAITRKWAVRPSRYTQIAPPATACFMHIFWTGPQYRACLPVSIGSIGYHFFDSCLNLYANSVYYPVDNFIFRTYDTQYSSFRSYCCTVFCRARSQAPGPRVPPWKQEFPRRISQPYGMIRS
jgi:hypothetical protein